IIYALIPIVISIAAFVFSLFTWRERKAQDQRDLFLQIHERLAEVDLQHGRRILFQDIQSAKDARALSRNNPRDYDLASRALAMLDIAALYVEHDYIDKKLFMNEWGFTYATVRKHAQYFIDERISRGAMSAYWAWPHFLAFSALAAQYLMNKHGIDPEAGFEAVTKDQGDAQMSAEQP